MTTVAGIPAWPGWADGTTAVASFGQPTGVAVGPAGHLVVADSASHTVRRVANGEVTTIAGRVPEGGWQDGTGSAARFDGPAGMAVDGAGTLYVSDAANQVIRKVTPAGVVTTWVGAPGQWGWQDGAGADARFRWPAGLAVHPSGTVFVADMANHVVRKVTPEGVVSTLAGKPAEPGYSDGVGEAARFRRPRGVALEADGSLLVADEGNHAIRRVSPQGEVTTVAGLAEQSGYADGSGSQARFSSPADVAVDAAGNAYVADSGNAVIRKLTHAGQVTTFAGQPGVSGTADGPPGLALLWFPRGVAVDAAGHVFVVSDTAIRRVSPAGDVVTIGGRSRGVDDGAGDFARFVEPLGIAASADGTVFVADRSAHAIRKGLPANGLPWPVVVSRAGPGTGRIISLPAGIDCGDACTGSFTSSEVTLVAIPEQWSYFGGWSGACEGSETCTVRGGALVMAWFWGRPPRLTVVPGGTGTGVVVSTPPGISCPPTCEAFFPGQPAVTLTMRPDPGFTFTGWGVEGCPGLGPCTLLPDEWTVAWPRFSPVRYLAEGAASDFFRTEIALLNPGEANTVATVTFLRQGEEPLATEVPVKAGSRATIDPRTVLGNAGAEFSTTVVSGEPLVVDRTMRWGVGTDDGAHGEKGVLAASPTWYLAEGATHSGFDLFYLLQNPNPEESRVRVRYLLPHGAPLEKEYPLRAESRTNIWVNYEDIPGAGTALSNTDVSAVLEVIDGGPIIVERAMYAPVAGQPFGAGHAGAGVTAPALEWFLAEGATGPYWDLFVLVANPTDLPATVEATYLLPDGTTIVRPYAVGANSRFSIWVDHEDSRLAHTAVSTTIRSLNGVPVIVERAMWWPGDGWHEAHCSAGATETGTKWALAAGAVDPSLGKDTYYLIANTSAWPATVRVRLHFEDGTSAERVFADLPPSSRTDVSAANHFFLSSADRPFGAVIESLGDTPAQIVVEGAVYWNAGGRQWAAGANLLATRLQ